MAKVIGAVVEVFQDYMTFSSFPAALFFHWSTTNRPRRSLPQLMNTVLSRPSSGWHMHYDMELRVRRQPSLTRRTIRVIRPSTRKMCQWSDIHTISWRLLPQVPVDWAKYKSNPLPVLFRFLCLTLNPFTFLISVVI